MGKVNSAPKLDEFHDIQQCASLPLDVCYKPSSQVGEKIGKGREEEDGKSGEEG